MDVKDEGSDKVDDVMLPGFRFHPTDEELVVFYLTKKIQQRPLAVELIKQLDIYKYDPWDLPRLAASGEKEWYFYCPRDRKYRNSARPNRVTESGFWKATGTDRPIYNPDATKCVGLKKSLVFYRGRAAKGIKTDWMMHEFRLPPSSSSQNQTQTSTLPNKYFDRSLPPNDSWAICRIFKKTNSTAQKALLAHSWLAPFSKPTPTQNTIFPNHETTSHNIYTPYTSDNVSCTTETGSTIHLSGQTNSNNPNFSPINHKEPIDNNPSFLSCKTNDDQHSCNFMFPQQDSIFKPSQNILENVQVHVHTVSQNTTSTQQDLDKFLMCSSSEIQDEIINIENRAYDDSDNYQWLNSKMMIGFPFNLPSTTLGDTWNFLDCPSEISNTYSTSKYT